MPIKYKYGSRAALQSELQCMADIMDRISASELTDKHLRSYYSGQARAFRKICDILDDAEIDGMENPT